MLVVQSIGLHSHCRQRDLALSEYIYLCCLRVEGWCGMRTEWVKEAGATLGELLRAIGSEDAVTAENGWWSEHLDAETHLRLVEGEAQPLDAERVWDEAARVAHVGRFRFTEEHS